MSTALLVASILFFMPATVTSQERSASLETPDFTDLAYTFWRFDHLAGASASNLAGATLRLGEIESFRVDVRGCIAEFNSPPMGATRADFRPSSVEGRCPGLTPADFGPSRRETYDEGTARFARQMEAALRSSPALLAFRDALLQTAGRDLNGDALSLLDGSGRELMRLTKIAPEGVEHARWEAVAWEVKGKMVSSRPTFYPFLVLAEGSVWGSPGCGGLRGSYRRDGLSLRLNVSWFLGGVCAEDPAHSNEFCEALLKVRSFKDDGDRRLLLDQSGRTVVILAPWPKPVREETPPAP